MGEQWKHTHCDCIKLSRIPRHISIRLLLCVRARVKRWGMSYAAKDGLCSHTFVSSRSKIQSETMKSRRMNFDFLRPFPNTLHGRAAEIYTLRLLRIPMHISIRVRAKRWGMSCVQQKIAFVHKASLHCYDKRSEYRVTSERGGFTV